MVILLRRNRIRLLALLMAATAAGILWTAHRDAAAASAAAPARAADGWTIVLDAGHGGEDGGAVSRGGVPESGINLQIAKKMQGLLAFLGRGCVMTRADEAAIYSPEAKTLREKKVSDLKNRVKLVESTPNALLLSIHQNFFPETKYHGAQVFYAKTPGSEALAEDMQAVLRACVDSSNHRRAKPSQSVYLMDKISCTGVLVECGFLSNELEAERLTQKDYQQRLAGAICGALCAYLETEGDSQ